MVGLKLKRIERKITQLELAKFIGISSQSIYAYECGKRFPRQKVLKILAEALDCTIDELL